MKATLVKNQHRYELHIHCDSKEVKVRASMNRRSEWISPTEGFRNTFGTMFLSVYEKENECIVPVHYLQAPGDVIHVFISLRSSKGVTASIIARKTEEGDIKIQCKDIEIEEGEEK